MRTVVLGAGLGACAVAARLARMRHDVTIVDPAGRLARIEGPARANGLVDAQEGPGTPPTVLWLPAVYRDLFISTGRPLERELELTPADPARRYVMPDGTVLDLPTGSRAATLDAFGRAFGSAAATEWDDLITAARSRWQEVRPALAPGGPGEAPVRARPRWRRGRTGDKLRDAANRLADPRNRLIHEWYAFAAGADPGSAGAELAVLPYLEHAFGTWQPVGGAAALHAAVLGRARARGTGVISSRTIAVRVRSDGVAEVDLADGTTIEADVVIDARTDTTPSRSSAGQAVTIVVACTAVPDHLPVETILLAPLLGETVVVGRPDVVGQPDLVTVHAHTSAGLSTTVDGLAAGILARASPIGVDLRGEVLSVTRAPARRAPARRRVITSASATGLIEDPGRATEGMLRVGTPLGGPGSLPMLGLSAALVAAMVEPAARAASRASLKRA